jgi:predicted acetyltransferase
MMSSEEVVLEVASADDAAVLANLLQLYIHDMSEFFGGQLDAAGRFGYDKLPLYWSEANRRFAFLIRSGAQLAGFAMVTRGSPASEDPNDLDMANFFVVRAHRRAEVGRRAAFLLWDRFPGRWWVRVSEGNSKGCGFWASIIAEYTSRPLVQTTLPGDRYPWRVFSFSSEGARQPGCRIAE